MTNKKKINIETLPTTESKNKVIEVKVRYNKGGINWANSQEEERGYYLSATPCESGNGMKVYGAFTGTKILIETANRFSNKKLEEIASNIKTHERYTELVTAVAERNNLTIA
jgi:hypothetical protein